MADPATTLRGNLARFRSHGPDLAERVALAEGADATVVAGPRGQWTIAWRGTLLASAYDPRGEGEALAARVPGDTDVLVALGFGTGHQLDALLSRGDLRVIVFEPRVEVLRAAFSAAPLPFLGLRDLRITDRIEELVALLQRCYRPGLRLHVAAHPSLARSDPELVRDVTTRISRAKDLLDIDRATLRLWARPWAEATVENARHALSLPGIGCLEGRLADATAVVCAAGPSLTKQLPWLAQHREKLLVLAIGQSLAALEAAGIRPDLVQLVENQDVSHQLTPVSSLEEQTLVLSAQAHPNLYRLRVRQQVIGWDRSNPLGCWLAALSDTPQTLRTGGSVAVSSVYLAAFLGSRKVLLIGQDLAFTGGERYAEASVYGGMGVEEEADGRVFFTNLKTKADLFDRPAPERELAPSILRVEGWDGGEVITDRNYASFREAYRSVGEQLASEGCEVLNCTEGGARIPGLVHVPFAKALAALPDAPVRARERIDSALADARPVDPACVGAAIRGARRELETARRLATRCRARCADALGGSGPSIEVGRLRGVQKVEKDLRKRMGRLPMLEFLMQQELQELVADSLHGADLSERGRIVRSAQLSQAVETAADRLDELLGQIALSD